MYACTTCVNELCRFSGALRTTPERTFRVLTYMYSRKCRPTFSLRVGFSWGAIGYSCHSNVCLHYLCQRVLSFPMCVAPVLCINLYVFPQVPTDLLTSSGFFLRRHRILCHSNVCLHYLCQRVLSFPMCIAPASCINIYVFPQVPSDLLTPSVFFLRRHRIFMP